MAFSGDDFGFGSITSTGPEFKYSVNATLDNATNVLTFEGQRNTS
ncbi:MAG: hypothetical protein ACJ71C_01335 [Nitrososphaeraceae archaeon]|jgi:hypothetical protein